VPESVGAGAVRFSLGRTTTRGEIDETVELITRVAGDARFP
jgi:cysteine sulfinate desulfinase/cysteine desulfurase-like protein